MKPDVLVEPFAGGAIVGLTAASERLTRHVVLVELDHDVAAVWKTILGRHAQWLAERILSFEMCPENLHAALNACGRSVRDRAFCTILRNRTLHGGILARGSSWIKRGENGKGLLSRWYPETLAKRIRHIHDIRDRITFVEGDGLATIKQYAHRATSVFFVDPPYTASTKNAGKRLYTHHKVDHAALFDLVASATGDFLMTYDDDPAIREMACRRSLAISVVPMQTRRLNTMHELLIARNLEWVADGGRTASQRLLFK